MRRVLLAIGFLLVLPGVLRADAVKVTSPSGRIEVEIGINALSAPFPRDNYLTYTLRYDGKDLTRPSPIWLELADGPPIGREAEMVDWWVREIDEMTELYYGKNRYLVDRCRELTVILREPGAPGRWYELQARAYDDAAALRLRLPRQPGLARVVVRQEHTFVRLHPGVAYALQLKGFRTNYENTYTVAPTGQLPREGVIGLPILIDLETGPWISITEANLDDYPGLYLVPFPDESGTFVSRLAPLPDDEQLAARIELPHDLPWRVFWITDHPGKLIESDVILALNEPSRIENPCWIVPGKAAWPWWSRRTVVGRSFQGGMNTATQKYYIDFAAEAGLEYLLIDAGWYGDHRDPRADITKTVPEIDMPEIIRYAEHRGVGVILWVNWQCLDRQMEEALALYEKWGVKGVKVDYMDRDDQVMVNFYKRVVRSAARHHLIVDFHGAFKPTGLCRTYPNLLTREGVLGLEYSRWSDRCSPEHEVTIPYIRMLAGPMDFTPGAFHVATRESFIPRATPPMAQGTRAHQLAMYVVYYSPLQMLVDHPSSYWGQTGFEFLKAVPTVWDETRFLQGKVGDYIVLARRHRDEWYLGCMTDWEPRDLEVPLRFLGRGRYLAQIYADGDEADKVPTSVKAEVREVTAADTLHVHLAPGGGCAVRFVPTWSP
ncbi:MAG: glycoside hydrolase family 97 protein [candidate division KSB1 bacterium]|nr:glycoside hydrolase family 97 protein [candidate division KSB1 bacterium]